ncbi:hypothetical protein Raf01_66550 [Rugosimonospora africana]|uniref:NlpC/P60 domain-containing protein n=1 Tax=Rugosimonospora africana TaxID=556532 RepID=A0A8J3QX36_9ACTN|nr:hypothetical protein Raf01_66550 [Rugosimonospora africana]
MGVPLPHNAAAQAAMSTPVDRAELRVGDLVFYGTDSITTVTLYVGGDEVVGVYSPGTVVHTSTVDFAPVSGYGQIG